MKNKIQILERKLEYFQNELQRKQWLPNSADDLAGVVDQTFSILSGVLSLMKEMVGEKNNEDQLHIVSMTRSIDGYFSFCGKNIKDINRYMPESNYTDPIPYFKIQYCKECVTNLKNLRGAAGLDGPVKK